MRGCFTGTAWFNASPRCVTNVGKYFFEFAIYLCDYLATLEGGEIGATCARRHAGATLHQKFSRTSCRLKIVCTMLD